MLTNLIEQISAEMQHFEVCVQRMSVEEMFCKESPLVWLSDAPSVPHDGVLKALLLGVPITLYVHEHDLGVLNVVNGAELFEGLRYYMANQDKDVALHRKVVSATIELVVFRVNMTHEDVLTVMRLISSR